MTLEERLRTLAPQVLGVLVGRHGDFDRCEDAVQEALLAAVRQWPRDGVPDNPQGWLVRVASRRWIELWRSERARSRREAAAAALEPPPPEDDDRPQDDTLLLLFMCCHPALRLPSQVALTLRAVGGLTTAEIARGLLVPEATVAQRVSRAKARLRRLPLALPPREELDARLTGALRVLHLVFTEGSTAARGPHCTVSS